MGWIALLRWTLQVIVTLPVCVSADVCVQNFFPSDSMAGTFQISPWTRREVQRCQLIFHNDDKLTLTLTFDDLKLADTLYTNCDQSGVTVMGVSPNAAFFPRLLQKFCSLPQPPLIASVMTLIVIMLSRGNMTYLHGNYSYAARGTIKLTHSRECGPQYIKGTSGTLTSDAIIGNVHCNWMIMAEEGRHIMVRLTQLHIGASDICSPDNSLDIFDGMADPVGLPDFQFCGNHRSTPAIDRQFSSSGRNISIRYSRLARPSDTFTLEWNEIWEPHQGVCSGGFICPGGAFCTDNEQLACKSIGSFCIETHLICDGSASCGLFDGSDELNCDYLHRLLMIVLPSVSGFFVAVLLVAFFLRRAIRRRQEREKAARNRLLKRRRRRAAWSPELSAAKKEEHNYTQQTKEDTPRYTSLPCNVYPPSYHEDPETADS